MNMDILNKWLTLVANAGVIAGIIFLSIEVGQQSESIDQSNRIANAQFLADDWAYRMNGYELKLSDNLPDSLHKAVFNPQAITTEDLMTLEAYYIWEWMRALQQEALILAGFSQSGFPALGTEWTFQILNNEIALKWWNDNQGGLLSTFPELRDTINMNLERVEENHSQMLKLRIEELGNIK